MHPGGLDTKGVAHAEGASIFIFVLSVFCQSGKFKTIVVYLYLKAVGSVFWE